MYACVTFVFILFTLPMFLIVLLCCEEIGINNTVNSRLVFKILTQLYLVVYGTNESHAIGIEIETTRRVTWDKIFHFARLCVVFFIIIFSIKRRSYEMKVSSSRGEENEQSVLFFVVAYGKMEEKKISFFSFHSCWWWKWSEKKKKWKMWKDFSKNKSPLASYDDACWGRNK